MTKLNLCSKCGVELDHDIEHDTADEKDLVRWWCPEHCPQCNAATDDLKVSDLWQGVPAEVRQDFSRSSSPLNLCSRCGSAVTPSGDVNAVEVDKGVRWWGPEHCSYRCRSFVPQQINPARPAENTVKAPPVCKKKDCSANRYYPTARGVKVDGFCAEHSTIDIEFVTALGHWQQHLKRVTAAIKEDGSDRDKPGQPMTAESLLSMQHRHYAELKRLTSELFGSE